MFYANNLLRSAITVLLAGGLASGIAACASTPEPQHQGDTTVHQVMPTSLAGCNAVDVTSEQRGTLGAHTTINEQHARAVVVYSSASADSHIGLPGDDSCLWITGNVGPDATIDVRGKNSGVVIEGSIDPSVRIVVAGPGSITWLPKVTNPASENAPDLRIAGTGGGLLIFNGLEEFPH